MSEIPETWRNATIGELCDFSGGYGFRPNDWSTEGLPIIRIQNLNGSNEFNYYAGRPEEDWLVHPGTILFAWAGTRGVSFGPTVWNRSLGVLNQHIYRVRPRDDVDPDWLFWALKVITARVERKAHGFKTTLVHVRKAEITGQVVGVPPLPEQRKIARMLGTWAVALTKLEGLIAALRLEKKALMQQLLTGQVRFPEFVHTSDRKYAYGLGTIPAEWRADKLNEHLCQRTSWITLSDDSRYNRCTVKLHNLGVVPRDTVFGHEIATKKQQLTKTDDLLVAEIDAKVGGFGIVKPDTAGSIVSSHYSTFAA